MLKYLGLTVLLHLCVGTPPQACADVVGNDDRALLAQVLKHPKPRLLGATSQPSARQPRVLPGFLDQPGELNQLLSLAVPPNALGDMNEDGFVNLLDLLRIRDIAINSGPPTTPYELVEGDLDDNGAITSFDVTYVKDVLLDIRGLPHVIDGSGGLVVGNNGRTTFTIPEGAVSVSTRMCAEDYSLDEVEQDIGGPLSIDESAFLGGAKLVILGGTEEDALLTPVGLTEAVAGSNVPSSGNVVLNVSPDVDGDGVPELGLMGELSFVSNAPAFTRNSSTASTSGFMVYEPRAQLQVSGVERAIFDVATARWTSSGDTSPFESGSYVLVRGHGWRSIFPTDYAVEYAAEGDTVISTLFDVVTSDPDTYHGIQGVVFSVPYFENPALVRVVLHDRLTGYSTNEFQFEVVPPATTFQGDVRAAALNTYDQIGQLFGQLVAEGNLADSALVQYQEWVADFAAAPPEQLDAEGMALVVRYFENAQLGDLLTVDPVLFSQLNLDPPSCGECLRKEMANKAAYWACRNFAAKGCTIGCAAACPAGIQSPLCDECTERVCDPMRQKCEDKRRAGEKGVNKCWAECCPSGAKCSPDPTPTPTPTPTLPGQTGPIANLEYKTLCIHFDCNKIGGDVLGSGVPGRGLQSPAKPAATAFSEPNLAGIVVKVNDSPIPFSRALTDRTGKFFIPFNVLTDSVSFSAFDPLTGYFDPDIGTIFITDPIGEVHTLFGGTFEPDTSQVTQVCDIGELFSGQVDTSTPRFVCRFYVAPADTGRSFTFGMRADAPLSFILADPVEQLFNNAGATSCVSELPIVFHRPGTYEMTVAEIGQPSNFSIGNNYSPLPPTPYLCGTVYADRLLAGYSPYISADRATVVSADTLTVEPSAVVDFVSGGRIIANGLVRGTGTHENPIVLRPATSSKPDRRISSGSPN